MYSRYSSVRKKRNDCTDRNSRSVRHLACLWIAQDKLWVRTQSAFSQAEDDVSRALKQLAEKSTGGRPTESHNATSHAGDYQSEQELGRPNPGSDGCA